MKSNFKLDTVINKLQAGSVGEHYIYTSINQKYRPIYLYYSPDHFDAIFKKPKCEDLFPNMLAFDWN